MKTYYLALATMAVVTAVAAADARASEPTINVTPTNYCEYLGAFTLVVGGERDDGVSKRDAVTTLVNNSGHLGPRLQDDLLAALDVTYLLDLAPPGEVAGIVYEACRETYGEPL